MANTSRDIPSELLEALMNQSQPDEENSLSDRERATVHAAFVVLAHLMIDGAGSSLSPVRRDKVIGLATEAIEALTAMREALTEEEN
jgi:hypothetical protein